MNRIKKAMLAMTVVLALIAGAAMAEVRTTGNVNLRTGPGLDYEIVGSVAPDVQLEYLGEKSTDERGVDWYLVDYRGGESWISSRYCELIDEESATLIAYDPEAAADWVEVSGYYLCDLVESAEELVLTHYEEVRSEAPYQYSNASLTMAGYGQVEYMELEGAGYTLFGAACGMPVEEAKARMTKAGLALYMDCADVVVFQHPSDEKSLFDGEGFDSCINIHYADGVVARIDWSSYTG